MKPNPMLKFILVITFFSSLNSVQLTAMVNGDQEETTMVRKKKRTAQDDRNELLAKFGVTITAIVTGICALCYSSSSTQSEIKITSKDDKKNSEAKKKDTNTISLGTGLAVTGVAGLSALALYHFIR